MIRSGNPAKPDLSVAEFDRRADLPTDDPEGDLSDYIDWSKARQPGREVQRVNVDFPAPLLEAIDREVAQLGIPRQAWIKMKLADVLKTKS